MPQTRSAASRKEDSAEALLEQARRGLYEQPPASPSVEAGPSAAPDQRPQPLAEGGAHSDPEVGTVLPHTELAEKRRVPRPPSVRSTSSITVRVKQAEYEAERRLVELRRQELDMEAALIRKKLAWDVAAIQEDSDRESLPDNTNERVGTWLNESTTELLTTAPETASKTPLARANASGPVGTRGEAARLPPERRQRSPTPTRNRGRGIEQLAEAIQNIARARPPPRQAMELPIFSGAATDWLPFKAAMEETTSIYGFTATENIARLRNCLRGDAREAVSALLATTPDPGVIMKTLEQCFGRPEVIIDQALEQIKRLPKPGPSATELNSMAIKLQNIVCVLKQIDRRGYLHNPMLTREVVAKLSPHVVARWCDYAEEFGSYREPEIATLSRFLMQEADRALRHASTPAPHAPKREERRPYQPVRRAATHNVTIEVKPSCWCCKEDHGLPKCPKFNAMSISDRWELLKKERICFKCISAKHRRNTCRAKPCGKNECRRPHHPMLHTEDTSTRTTDTAASNHCNDDYSETVAATATSTIANKGKQVLLKICPVIVKGPAGEISTYALLDEGSTISLIDRDLAENLQSDGPTQNIHIHGVNSVVNERESRRVKLCVRGKKTGYFDLEARTIEGISLRGQTVPESILKYPHLKSLDAEEVCYEGARPQLLIGADYWHLIVTRQLRAGKRNEPVASRTNLGWVILGHLPRTVVQEDHATVVHLQLTEQRARPTAAEDERLEDLIKQHYEIDALGVSLKKKAKPEDERAINIIKKTAQLKNGRYEVGLPWRNEETRMPPSYESALRRLKGIERKMDKDADFAAEYEAQISNLLNKGYAERCDGSEHKSPKAWYLPHFAVKNPNKPGKVRLVFDAAAVSNDVSLNQELLEGPDLLVSLQGVLYRFRERPIAVTADIQEMFLQIKIRREDQPAQMFLWRGQERQAPPKKYKMTSMIFGAASSPFIAHSVRNMNAEAQEHTHPEAMKAIVENHYMDDYVDSYQGEEEAIKITSSVADAHKRAGFLLRSWNSNSPKVIESIPEELRASAPKQLGVNLSTHEKTLGLLWDAAKDTLSFNTNMSRVPEAVKQRRRMPTKREALSAVMSVFDPLGLASPYTIAAKIFLQELWRQKIGWDEPLPPEEARTFQTWLRGLDNIREVAIPRCYEPTGLHSKRSLHIFCDASEKAYAAVAYWHFTMKDGTVHVALAGGKAKVAPLKTQSIPRLELQAAVIGTRLADSIAKEHRWEVHEITYWTDSTTVLAWIRTNAKRYTAFVSHRLGEIAEATEPDQWRWVPTDLNPADDATRTLYEDSLPTRWITGPAFLKSPKEVWPQAGATETEDQGENETTAHVDEIDRPEEAMPSIERISKYECLIRATALVLLAVDKWRHRANQLEMHHIEKAEDMWKKRVQQEAFHKEIECLKSGKPIPSTSRLYRLDPELHDDLLRVRGRIDAAEAPETTKRPLILDGKHPFTRLLVDKEHRAAEHANNERVVNELRQRYWILRLRPTVRAVARACRDCRLRKNKPVVPSTGDLPTERLSPYCRPFTNCGLDYFGPMTVTVGRRHEKRWGALFTCLTTRAVHLEIVASLSTDSAIMALRRMAARRGWPKNIVSDNGTNFKGADKELQAAAEEWEPKLRDYLLERRVHWRFIPPGAPNQGGAWERMVRSVKTALAATLHERAPKEEVLQTLLLEAEHSVNSRPLTHVSVSPDDEESLTPNHFLIGTSSGLPPTGPCLPSDRRQWRVVQALADKFWQRWMKEFLPTLVPRGQPGREACLKKGDLVIVADPNLPRNVWPRGVVEQVFPGPDGEIRIAEVRTRGGLFRRPTRKLIVIDVDRTRDGAPASAPLPAPREGE